MGCISKSSVCLVCGISSYLELILDSSFLMCEVLKAVLCGIKFILSRSKQIDADLLLLRHRLSLGGPFGSLSMRRTSGSPPSS
jgi:hypothetical protein